MLRHTYVTTMLDAGVPLRDVQIPLGTRLSPSPRRRWPPTQPGPAPASHKPPVRGLQPMILTNGPVATAEQAAGALTVRMSRALRG
jgi:hypothetical protein